MTAIAAMSAPDTAARRLLYCVLVSLLLHMGLSVLKPGARLGLYTPAANVTRSPPAFEVTLIEQGQAKSGDPSAAETMVAATRGAPAREIATSDSNAVESPLPAFQPPQKQDLPPAVNGMLGGPWYYAAQYLHRRPSPLQPIRPDYPARSDNAVHTIRILMFISAAGKVDSYRVTGESDTLFAKTVISAFTTVDYAPGLIANIPVKSQLLAEVTFNPGEDSVHVDLSTPNGANLQVPAASPL